MSNPKPEGGKQGGDRRRRGEERRGRAEQNVRKEGSRCLMSDAYAALVGFLLGI
jgi:hypothetical protein